MAAFNLNPNSSQTQNYSTVVGENISYPIDMADLDVLWEKSIGGVNIYQSISDYTSSGNYALNGLISEIITVAGRDAYYTFEDLSGITAEYNSLFSGYEDRVGNAHILGVSEVSYSDGTSLDRISIYYDTSSSIYSEGDFENDYRIELYGTLSFDTYTDGTVFYSFDLKSYQKQYEDVDLLGVLKDPIRMNLYQEDPSSFVYDANGNGVAASLIGGSITVNNKEQKPDLDSLGFMDFTNPLETEGINIYFEDNPFVYNDYLDGEPPSYDDDTFSGSVSSMVAFKHSLAGQGIDVLRADLGINSFFGYASPDFFNGYFINGNTTISKVELTHGHGPFTFDFRTMGIALDSDTSSSYSASFNPTDNITLGSLSSETPLYDLFNGNDTLNLTLDTHGQTIFAGGGNDIVNAGSGNDIIYGNGGIDTIYANDGNDQIIVNNGFYSETNAFEADSGYNFLISEKSYRTDNTDDTTHNVLSPDVINGGDGMDTLVFKDEFSNVVTIEEGRFAQGTGGSLTLSFRSSWYDWIPSGDLNLIPSDNKYLAYTNEFEVDPFSSQTIVIWDNSNINRSNLNNPSFQNESYELTNVEYLEINGQLFDIRPLYLAQSGNVDETLYAFNSETWLTLNDAGIQDETSKYFFLGFNGAQYYYVDGLGGNDTIYGTDLRESNTIAPYLILDEYGNESYGDFVWNPGGYFIDDKNDENEFNDVIINFYVGEALNGGDGNDTLIGGAGKDIYFVNVAEDTVVESVRDDDFDTVVFAPNTSGLTYTIANNAAVERLLVNSIHRDTVTGEIANNPMVNLPSDNDQVNITGGNYTYELIGHNGANIIRAGDEAGLIAQPGQDTHEVALIGLGGNDTLHGGSGKDNFFGGSGNDLMHGNAGDDKFYFGLNSLEGSLSSIFSGMNSASEVEAFDSPAFYEYFYDYPQELTGGQDAAEGDDGIDKVVVISPLWDQPTFQRTGHDSITLFSVTDSLRVDNTTEIIHNHMFDSQNYNYESTTKILPFIWETIEEQYVITPAWSYQENYIASFTAVPIFATVRRRQVLQGYNQVPNWATRTVQVEAVMGARYYPDEKAIFEKIDALDDVNENGILFVAASEYNDFIVASSLDDAINFSNDLDLTSYNINGGAGNDMIFADARSNWIRGGAGQDFLYAFNSAEDIAYSVETVPTSIELTFNADADVATDPSNRIKIPAHGLSTGQAVVYHDGGSNAIGGGLSNQDGETFYVIYIDQDHIQLASNIDDAMNNAPIAIQALANPASVSLTTDTETISQTEQSLFGDDGNDTLTVDLSFNYSDVSRRNSETITFNPMLVLRDSFDDGDDDYYIDIGSLNDGESSIFGDSNAFPDGKKFIYREGSNGSIVGLDDEAIYTVVRIDNQYYELFDSNDNKVVFGLGSLDESRAIASNDYILEDFYTYTYEINAHGFKTGDAVVYGNSDNPFDNSNISGLNNAGVYYVIKIDDDSFQLADSIDEAYDEEPINVLDQDAPVFNSRPDGYHTFTFTPYLPYHFNLEGGAGDDTYRIKATYNGTYRSTFNINDSEGSNTLIYLWGDEGEPSLVNGVYEDELFFQWDINQLNAINNKGDILSSIRTGTISRFIFSDDDRLFTPYPSFSFNLINPSSADYLDGTIEGTAGNDLFFSINGVKNKFYGAAGNDYLILNEVNGGIASGGLGNNIIGIATAAVFNQPNNLRPNHTLSYEWTSAGMSSEIDLSVGFSYVENSSGNIIASDEFRDIEYFTNVTGGGADDIIIGNQYQNILIGGGGNDTLYAGNNIYESLKIGINLVDENSNTISYQNHGLKNGETVYVSNYLYDTFTIKLVDKNHFKLLDENDLTYDFASDFFNNTFNNFEIRSQNIQGGDLLQGGAGNDTLVDDSDFSQNDYYFDDAYIESPILEGGSGNDTYIIQHRDDRFDDYSADDIRPTLVRERANDNSDSGGIDTVRLERDNVSRSIWSSEEVNFNIAFEDDPNSNVIEIQPFYADYSDEINFLGQFNDEYTPGPNSAENVFDVNDLYTLTIVDHGFETGDRIRVDYNTYSQPVTIASFSFSQYDFFADVPYNLDLTATTTSDQIVDNLYKDKTYYVIKTGDDTFQLSESLGDALDDGVNENYGSDGSAIQIDRDGQLANTAGTFKIIKESVASIDFTANTTLKNNETVYVDFHNQLDYIWQDLPGDNNWFDDFDILSRDKFYNLSKANGQHFGLDFLESNASLFGPYYPFDNDSYENLLSLINPNYFDFLQNLPEAAGINLADVWSKTSNTFKDFNEVSYIQSGSTITVTGQQNYVVGDLVMLNFSNSNIIDGLYKVTALTNDGFKVNASSSGTSSGTVAFSDHIFDGYDFTWLDDNYVAISDTDDDALDDFNLDIDYYTNLDNHPVITESSNNILALVDKNALEYIDFASSDDQSLSFKYKVSFDRGTDNVNPEVIMSSVFAGSYLFGNAGTDIIFDTGDSDILLGGKGNDYIQSLSGYDLLNGGEGDDILHFRSQGQIVIGGKGADEFRVSGHDVWTTGIPQRELSSVVPDDFSEDPLFINESEYVALIKDYNVSQGDSIKLSRDFLDNLYIGYNQTEASAFDVGFTYQNNQIIFYLGESSNAQDPCDIYGLFKIDSNQIDYLEAQSIQDDLNHQLVEYSLSTFNTASLTNNYSYD